MGDLDELEAAIDEVPKTWPELFDWLADEAERRGDWSGIPVPVEGFRMTLEPRHPSYAYRDVLDLTPTAKLVREMIEIVKAEASTEELVTTPPPEEFSRTCSADDVDDTEWVRNSWFSYREQRWLFMVEKRGKLVVQRSKKIQPGSRFDMQVQTMLAGSSWDVRAEREAMSKLRSMVKPHLADMYELTGSFVETSPRSGLMYVFRRARPTVVMTSTDKSNEHAPMKILTVICLHPIGYYDGTWAGAMVPTDDVIAHLMMMRGDEHLYWRRANHHSIYAPEAGL